MNFLCKIDSEEEKIAVVKLMVDAYADDPVLNAVFRGRSMNDLFEILVDYYCAFQNTLIGKEDGQIVSVILWDDEKAKSLTITELLRKGILNNKIHFLINSLSGLLFRILCWTSLLRKNHYSASAHIYLCMIASKGRGKGYGSQIMREFLKDKTLPVYLENSNEALNGGFYKKMGYSKIGSFKTFGIVNERYLFEPSELNSRR